MNKEINNMFEHLQPIEKYDDVLQAMIDYIPNPTPEKEQLVRDNYFNQIKREKISEAKEYLASTDFYFTVDKYATLSEERKLELNKLRAEARALINDLEG